MPASPTRGRRRPTLAGACPAAYLLLRCRPAPTHARRSRKKNARRASARARSPHSTSAPPPDYGQFDAYYWPASSLMAAIVKMKFNFVEADNTPPPATLWSMWMSGQDITQFFWTDAQKAQFAEEYRNRVAARWSFAHTFRSNKPCWPFTASPYVAPRIVGDAADAHFDVNGAQVPGPGIDYKSCSGPRIPARRAGEGPASSMKRISGRIRTSTA